MKISFLLIPVIVLLVGCAAIKDKTLVMTGTALGVQIAENQGTGMYEAKVGYGRTEFVLTPTNNPNILMEFHTGQWFTGGIDQKLAVGNSAVSSGASTALFLKNRNGNFDTNV